jgi:hypothetical protein
MDAQYDRRMPLQIGVPNGARPLVLISGTCSIVVCQIAQDFASSALQCQSSTKPLMLGPITWWKIFMRLALLSISRVMILLADEFHNCHVTH